ncbi:MAG: sensor domain-containing diguanylate cyclase [Vulcanimicrobiaceae bacterium]
MMLARSDPRAHTYVDTLAYAAPSRRQRTLAGGIAFAAVALALGVAPWASTFAGRNDSFFAAFASVALLAIGMTAQILAMQYLATRYPPLGFLALAFAAEGSLVAAQLLAFPRVFATNGLFGAQPQTASWLYVAWHLAFQVPFAAYLTHRRIDTSDRDAVARANRILRRWVLATVVFVAASVLFAFRYSALAPPITVGTQISLAYRFTIAPAMLAITLLLLVVLVRRTRLRTVVDLWLAVTLLTLARSSSHASVVGSARFTYGWYFARVGWLGALVAYPLVLVAQMSRIISGMATDNRSLAQTSDTDALTGLLNRRGFDARFADGVTRCAAEAEPYSLLVLDVDEFKRYNDAFGHPKGDAALEAVAGAIACSVSRPDDLAARIGGEEFAVGLHNTGSDGAIVVAEYICATIEALAIPQYPGCPTRVVTVSVGVATTVGGAKRHRDLLARADRALYAAKHSGRNRIESDGHAREDVRETMRL